MRCTPLHPNIGVRCTPLHYGIDPEAKLRALPDDALTKLKASYKAAGSAPSNTQYGWIAR